ncbi:cytochrome c peroxidase [Parvibaculum indicum]|uniref:cytochrome-c peroxidase n=1 Tax=Parvibaculum indicum TaxID=562969 RepID=UPI0014209864|nr:cytochrome c peroxidase [Parvibaculum indicum]NIJ41507.1 cytochrome c peroxidase [Parvibaculum indicum]
MRSGLTLLVALCGLLFLGGIAVLVAGPDLNHDEAVERARLAASFPADPDEGQLAALKAVYAAPSAEWPAPRLAEGAAFRELAALKIEPRPEGEAAELARLGQDLFEDPRLSRSGQIACQNCHNRRLGWGDGLPTSFGHDRRQGRRNALSLFNAGYRETLFWDGRAGSLGEQALGPLTDPAEMANHDLGGIAARIADAPEYRDRFRTLFGGEEVGLDDLLTALAAFQMTLERRTRFDLFMAGNKAALTAQEVWGLHLFRTKAGCANCHNGPLFADEKFHNLGLSYYGRKLEDLGRYEVTGDPADAGGFRTASLRHVSRTGPYMHNGVFPSLEGLVNLYAAGGGRVSPKRGKGTDDPLIGHLLENSPLLHTFELTSRERDALVAFLNSL